MAVQSHRDLIVWQRGMELVVAVYTLARQLPTVEQFGLSSQLTRAAVSIPANIAEGRGCHGTREYANFCSIARGSLKELETLLEIGATTPAKGLADEVGRMLTTLIQRLREPTP